jgi:hypothetical protein
MQSSQNNIFLILSFSQAGLEEEAIAGRFTATTRVQASLYSLAIRILASLQVQLGTLPVFRGTKSRFFIPKMGEKRQTIELTSLGTLSRVYLCSLTSRHLLQLVV